MNTFTLRKAERKQAKLRIGLSGPSGSGKTYSALLLAKGLGGDWNKVALIDTENGSADLYSDLGTFSVITLKAPYTPERYIEAVNACVGAGMEVIVIDSASHEWDGEGGCLQLNEKLASAKFKGNTWSAWSETTPRHQKFVESITTAPVHVITTARSKTETVMGEDKKVKKVGMKEIQRDGFEYELTINFNIDRDQHLAIASKDRTKLFISRDPFIITEETGKEVRAWNESGAVDTAALGKKMYAELVRLDLKMPDDKVDKAEFARKAIRALTGIGTEEKERFPEILALLEKVTDKDAAYEKAWGSKRHGTEDDVIIEPETQEDHEI